MTEQAEALHRLVVTRQLLNHATDQRNAAVRDARGAGLSLRAIAEHSGLSKDAVAKICGQA